jgi:hypothetical protein
MLEVAIQHTEADMRHRLFAAIIYSVLSCFATEPIYAAENNFDSPCHFVPSCMQGKWDYMKRHPAAACDAMCRDKCKRSAPERIQACEAEWASINLRAFPEKAAAHGVVLK